MTRNMIAAKAELGMPILVAALWCVFAMWGVDWR